ncbi:hypothetical protein [Nocardia sp. NBC_00511]|uniref:hypothetical protein n=1 Tax=Nocardia sp. NBC_00511 TaxID=2903591 RepID=UPI0030E4A338
MKCPDCDGAGDRTLSGPCPDCAGRGWNEYTSREGFETSAQYVTRAVRCGNCYGEGYLNRPLGYCRTCNRTGQVRRVEGIVPCEVCDGWGFVHSGTEFYPSGQPKRITCPNCQGQKRIPGFYYVPDYS